MSTSASRSPLSAASFALESLESRLLLSATALPEPDASSPDTGSTSVLALAGLGHADLLASPASPHSPSDLLAGFTDSPLLVLTSATLNDSRSDTGGTVVYGTSDLLTRIVVGDGTSTAVELPGQTTLLQADSIDVRSPLHASTLVVQGDGTTLKLNNVITGVLEVFIDDSVEVSGNFTQSPVRSINVTNGPLTITKTLNGDNHAGALAPVNENAGADDVVLNATGAISIVGAVGGISGNGLQHLSVNIAGGTVGNVSFGSTVTLAGNLYVKKGLNVTFSGNVVVAGDLIIEDAADVRFDGGLTVGGSLRIMKAGNVTFAGNVAVTGQVVIGRPDALANIASVSFTAAARFDFGGSAGIYSAGAISFGNNIGESVAPTLRPDALTLASGGSISFATGASVLLDTTTPFVVTQATDITFGSDIATGNLTIGRTGLVTGNIAFNGTSNAVQSLDITSSGALGRVTVSNNILIGGGDATITANEVNFGVSATIASSGPYASTLVLKPYNTARAIVVGTGATGAPANINDRFDLNSDDLRAIQAGFANVIIGDRLAATGLTYIGAVGSNHASHQFVNRTIIVGGSLVVTQNLDVTSSVDYLRLVARTGNLTVNGVINRGATNGADLADESFNERNAWIRLEAANDIIVNRAVYAATRISLSAGTDGSGSIQLNSTGSDSGLLRTLSTAAGARRVELVAGESSGDITLIDEPGATTIQVAGANSSLVLRANSGAISQTDGLLVAHTLAVWARNNVGLRTDVSQIASQTLDGDILPGGTGAAITANMTGSVTTIFLTNGGTGYTSAPTVTLSAPPPGGTQATATATVVGGFVTGITIATNGAGYLNAPTVTISGGGGTGATALALVSPGALASLTIDTNGSGYTAAPTVSILGDGRTVATGSATISGIVGAYLVTSAGSSYTTAPLVVTGTATGSSTINLVPGQLTAANLTNAGAGYASAPTVSLSPSADGSGAAVTALLSASLFSTSRTPGSGYTYTPTVYISGGAASRVVNGLQMVGAGNVSIVNSGALSVVNATTSPDSSSTRGSLSLTTLAGNLALGYLNTSTGAITLTAAGAITDADTGSDSLPNLVTTGLVTLTAATGIGGSGGSDIDVTIGSLQATNSSSGDIYVQHSGLTGLTLTGTGVQTQGGNGSINIQSSPLNSNTATLTVAAPVTAHGSGNIRLQATGAQSDLVLSTATADLASTSGHITLIAERNLTSATGTRLSTTGGSIHLESGTGVITMADDSLATATGGAIRVSAPGNVTLGGLSTGVGTGSVSVFSTGASILDAGDTHRDIIGGTVRLSAFTGVAAAANPLEITAGSLAAAAAANGITLVETDDLTIASVSTSNSRVNLDGSTTTVSDTALADLATTLNGSVSLTSTSGSITLQDGDADNHAVSASGTGRVFLSAGVNIVAQSDILSGSGAISVHAAQSISFTAGSDVRTTGNTVDLLATAGSITQTDTAVVSTSNGAIRAQAGLDVTVASFNAGTAGVSILSGRDILDGGDTDRDLVASSALLSAATTAGAAANALETTLATLAAVAGSGGINISELDALVIDSVSVVANRVVAAHTASPLPADTLADLVTTGNGPVKIVTGGNLTLNKGDADDHAIDAAGSGTIDLNVTGVLTMSDGTIARTGTGSVSMTATGNILLSIVSSTSGDFTLTSTGGALSDNLTGEAANLATSGLAALDASTGIGATGTADIDTALGSITAKNRVSGQIVIDEADALTVAAAGLDNDAAGAALILTTAAGTLTVSGPVSATGSGLVLLSAAGTDADLIASTAISTGSGGHVTLLAARHLTLNTGASVATLGTGTLDLEATAGSITFANGVAATSGSGNIRLLAAQDIALTGLSTTGHVTATATAGSITDSGENLRDIVAATARLSAAIGIGATGALETTVDTLAASATTGGVFISELDNLSIGTVAALSVNRVAPAATTSSVGDSASTSDVEATTGAINISAGGSLTLTDGVDADTRAVHNTTGAITLSAVQALTFQASVVSTSGDISASSSAANLVDDTVTEGALIVTTGLASLNAATGVGAATAGDIDTTIGSLRGVLSTSGGFFVEETDTLTVHADGILTQAGNAPVSLVVTTGNLTVSGPITAHGSGNIHVNTKAGTATVDAAVSSTTGHVTFLASGAIALNADIASGSTGTLNVVSSGGSITQIDGVRARTGSGDILLKAATSVALAGLSTTGNASVTATSGAITDAGSTHVDAVASALRLQAGTAIATSADHLETTVATLSARAQAGGVFILETDGLTVTNTSATVNVVLADASALGTSSEGTQSDLVTDSSDGQVVLRTTTGDITLDDGSDADNIAVSANGTGSILIDALAGNLTANADLLSGTGHITLKADDNIALTSEVDVATASTGTVSLDAETGTLTMHGTADILASSSSARLRAQGDITVGNITATNVSIDSDAGSIINAALSTKNVTATNLRLQAANSIGASDRHLTTNITNLTALAATGSIYVTEDNAATVRDVAVTVTDFTSSAGTTAVNDAAQSDLTTGANGHIILVAISGSLTLNDGADSDNLAVSAHGTGNVLLQAATSTITANANADILSGTGHVTVFSSDTITFNTGADIATGGTGTVLVRSTSASVTQADNSRFTAANGDIRVAAVTDITVGGVTTSGNASILTTTGSILDAGDASGGADLVASGLRLSAATAIGSALAQLDTSAGTVAARATSGGIHLRETDALVLGTVSATVQQVGSAAGLTPVSDASLAGVQTTAGNGLVDIRTAAGAITVANDSSAHGSGSFTLVAGGSGDIVLAAVASSTTGALSLTSGGRIRETTSTETPVLVTGGVLTLSAVTGLGETGRADLDVSAPSLSFASSGVGQAYLKSHSAGATLTGASVGGSGSLIFTQVTGGLAIAGAVNIADGSATFRVPGALTLTNAPVTTGANLTLVAASLSAAASDLTSGGALRVSASGSVTVDAATDLDGDTVAISAGTNVALAQVDATGLLAIQAGGSVTTVTPSASLVSGQFRLSAGGNAGTDAAPLLVDSAATDVVVTGETDIVYLNGLTLGRAGFNFNTAPGGQQTLTVDGGVIGTIGGTIVDQGSGTLRFDSAAPVTLAASVVSVGGNITIVAPSTTDGTPGEAALLTASAGRVTLVTQTGIGATGAGDIDFVASEITATTVTGGIALDSGASTTIAGAGLLVTGAASTGAISLTVNPGSLSATAPITNSGSGGVSFNIPQGTFTMTAASPITTNVGAVSIQSLGSMTIGRITSTTGLVSLVTSGAISTVNQLNFANVTSTTSPFVSFVTSINILVNSNSVNVLTPYITTTYPEYSPGGVPIERGGSDDIDLSVYSDLLTGNS